MSPPPVNSVVPSNKEKKLPLGDAKMPLPMIGTVKSSMFFIRVATVGMSIPILAKK